MEKHSKVVTAAAVISGGMARNVCGSDSKDSVGGGTLKHTMDSNEPDSPVVKRARNSPLMKGKSLLKCGGLPHIYLLPDEILLQIFKLMDVADLMDICLTCERFFVICSDRSLWKVITINDVEIKPGILEQYMSFAGPHTEEIYITGTSPNKKLLSFDELYLIKLKCPHLRVLHLVNQALDAMELFVTVFPSTLVELSLARSTFTNARYMKRFLNGLDTYFVNLESLILSECSWFATHSIMLISKLPKLRKLQLDGCTQLRDFMPYLSLSTRYGFKCLEEVDLRHTFVSDSDITCFVATKTLKALYLEFTHHPDVMIIPEYLLDSKEPTNFEPAPSVVWNLRGEIADLEKDLKGLDTVAVRTLKINIRSLKRQITSQYISDIHNLYENIQDMRQLVDFERNIPPPFVRRKYQEQSRYSRRFEPDLRTSDEILIEAVRQDIHAHFQQADAKCLFRADERMPGTSGIFARHTSHLKRSHQTDFVGKHTKVPGQSFERKCRKLKKQGVSSEDAEQRDVPRPSYYTPKKVVRKGLGVIPVEGAGTGASSASSTTGSASSAAAGDPTKSLADRPGPSREPAAVPPPMDRPSTSTSRVDELVASAIVHELPNGPFSRTFEIATYPMDEASTSNAGVAVIPQDNVPSILNLDNTVNYDMQHFPRQLRVRMSNIDASVRCVLQRDEPLLGAPSNRCNNDLLHMHDLPVSRNHVIVVISRNNNNLVSFGISDLHGPSAELLTSTIGDRTVHSMFNPRAECVQLSRISLRGYPNITDDSLGYLGSVSHGLTLVDVRGTKVTENGCVNFKIRRPDCDLKCDFDI